MTRGLRVSASVLCVLSFTMARNASAGVGSSTDPGSGQSLTPADGAFPAAFGLYGSGYSAHPTTQTSNTKSSFTPRPTVHVTGSNSHGVSNSQTTTRSDPSKFSQVVFNPKDSHNHFVRTSDGKNSGAGDNSSQKGWDHQSDGHDDKVDHRGDSKDDHDRWGDDRNDHKFDDHDHRFDFRNQRFDDHHCYGRDFDWVHDKADLRYIKFDERGHGGDDRDRNVDDHDHKFDDHDHKFDACRAASR